MLATFTAHGSSRPIRSLFPDCCRSKLPFHLGVRLQSRSSHLTCPSDFDSPFGSRRVVHQAHVSRLSPGQTPYPAGYGFPSPFGCWPSLLGPSFPAAEFRPSCVGPTGRPPDSNGVSTFRTEEMRSGGMPSLLRGRLVSSHDCSTASRFNAGQEGLHPLAQHRRISHLATTKVNGASTMVTWRSSLRSSPSPAFPYGSGLPWTFPLAM